MKARDPHLATYVEIAVPGHAINGDVMAPESLADVERAVELALATVNIDEDMLIVEQATLAKYEFAASKRYGIIEPVALRNHLVEGLLNPIAVAGTAVPREWVAGSATITTSHPVAGLGMDETLLSIHIAEPRADVLARVATRAGGHAQVETHDGGWEIKALPLLVRITESPAIDYEALYRDDALEDQFRWVSALGKHTEGLGNVVHGSAPVIRPGHGGFLEVYGCVVTQVRSSKAMWRAFPGRRRSGFVSWFLARTAVYTGWVLLPAELDVGGPGDLLAYLHSPASLNAGWVRMDQVLFADLDQANMVPFLTDPQIVLDTIGEFFAHVDGIDVRVNVVKASTAGGEVWCMMRLTRARRGTAVGLPHNRVSEGAN